MNQIEFCDFHVCLARTPQIAKNLIVALIVTSSFQQPVQQTKIEKEISFSKLHCISMGVLDCRLMIAKRAFVPGERVKVDVEVENHTGKKIRDISMMLRQVRENLVSCFVIPTYLKCFHVIYYL